MIPGIVAQAMPGTSSGGGVGATELLLGFNGLDGAKSFPDEGLRARAVTWRNDVKISTAQSKFGGSSAYFDGGGDGLYINPGPGLLFGASPFTIEAWIRPSRVNVIQAIIAHRTGDGTTLKAWSLYLISSGKLEFQFAVDDAVEYNMTSINSIVKDVWTHVAVDRDALGTVRLYINGVMEKSELGIAQIREFRKPITIGCRGDTVSEYLGWIDELRITKGEARYGSDTGYDVPTGAFARPVRDPTPPADPYFANVLLLLGFDGLRDVYEVREDSNYHRPSIKSASGTAIPADASQISTVQPGVFGRQSLVTQATKYDFGDSDDWAFGTDPFTIECWLRYDDGFATSHIVGQRPTFGSATDSSWEMVLQTTGVLEFQANDASSNLFISTPATSTTVGSFRYGWNHVAVTRDGAGVYRLYINGIMLAKNDTTTVQNIRNVSTPFTLAGPSSMNDGNYRGNLDEVRITRGTARYTTDTRFDLPETLFSRNEPGPPSYTVAPTITSESGFFAVGDLLRLNPGNLNGYEPVIQWRRNGTVIPAATRLSYRLTVEDDGKNIDARVTRWNYSGTTTATAAAVGPIQTAPAFDTGAILTAGDMQSGTDRLIPAGDMQSGGDALLQKERVS